MTKKNTKTSHSQKLGKQGELIAQNFLIGKGYQILEQNYRQRFAELDIIAFKKNEIVFVEVKTRSSLAFGYPAESVNLNKIKKISQAAAFFLIENPSLGPQARFDVIEVFIFPHKPIKINHLINAFDYCEV